MSFNEVLESAKREFLQLPGVVAVSGRDNTIIVYVETEDDVRRIPSTYRGYPVVTRVVGRIIFMQ
jgi:hypothetical protein